jgi:hypothetical protein
MTIIEAGVIAGIPTGAIVGGVMGKAHGVPGVIGGSLAGMAAGAAAGWLYAFLVIGLLSVVGVLWRAARKRADAVPAERDMKLITPIANRGIFVAGLVALAFWFSLDWACALVAALAIGLATAAIAVGRCELR